MLSVLAQASRQGVKVGRRGFAVIAVDSVDQFTTAVKEGDKAVAYFTAT